MDRAARELIRDFDSTISAADISGDLLSLYNYMGTGREGNDELTYTEARRRADEIAPPGGGECPDHGGRRFIRNTVSFGTISAAHRFLSPRRTRRTLADYNDFRRRNFGRLNLRSGDTNIDQV